MVCQWRPDASSWKLIAAHLTIHLNGGPSLAIGYHFWLPKLVPRTDFGCQIWSGGTSFSKISAKISSRGPVFGGTEFGVTELSQYLIEQSKEISTCSSRVLSCS